MTQFQKNPQKSNFLKAHPMGAQFLHADGWRNMTLLTVPIRNFANTPKNARYIFVQRFHLSLSLTKHNHMQHVYLFLELLNHSSDILLCITALKYLPIYTAVLTYTYSVSLNLCTDQTPRPLLESDGTICCTYTI